MKIVAPHIKLSDLVMILSVIVLIAYLCRRFFGSNVFTLIPTIDNSITYGMLGLVDFHLPDSLTSGHLIKPIRLKGRKSSFIIGLLNGLMPCGPLQAMQLYALTTGSPALGALSMFLFAIGTVPLMFTFGIVSNLMIGKSREWFHRISAMLVLVLSIVMANRGLSILGIHVSQTGTKLAESFVVDDNWSNTNSQTSNPSGDSSPTDNTLHNMQYANYLAANLEDGMQKVSFHLTYSDYADVLLQKGIPVEINIIVDDGLLTGCNNEVISRDFSFDIPLTVGDNVITFTPDETGDYIYSCWMNMIENRIKVIDDENYFEK